MRYAATLVGIMMAVSCVVNALAKDTPKINQTSRRDDSKSKSSLKNDFSKILNMILTTGGTDHMKETLAEFIGLSGQPPVKGLDNTVTNPDGSALYREFSAVYPEDSGPENGHPICVYFNRLATSRHDVESHWYRVDLKGNLEKAVIHYNKLDDKGEVIPGKGSLVDEDINLARVQKGFRTEMAFWLKRCQDKQHETKSAAEKKAQTRAAVAPAASQAP